MRFEALSNNKPRECLYLLSGSQAFELMQNVSESLAGRLAILPLQGISYREQKRYPVHFLFFLPSNIFPSAKKKA